MYYITDPTKGTFAGYTKPDRQPSWIANLDDLSAKDVCYYKTEAEARIAAQGLRASDPALAGVRVETEHG